MVVKVTERPLPLDLKWKIIHRLGEFDTYKSSGNIAFAGLGAPVRSIQVLNAVSFQALCAISFRCKKQYVVNLATAVKDHTKWWLHFKLLYRLPHIEW